MIFFFLLSNSFLILSKIFFCFSFFFLLQYPLVNPPIMNEGPAVEMDPTPLRKMPVDVNSEKISFASLWAFRIYPSSKSPQRSKTDFSEFTSTGTRVCGYIATLMSPVPCS